MLRSYALHLNFKDVAIILWVDATNINIKTSNVFERMFLGYKQERY